MTEPYVKDPYNKRYSISATEDHVSCARRRWFKKTCKLPTVQSTSTIFGDIGHACNERFLLADDRGMNKDGKPAEIFPAGWMTMKPRFGKDDTTYSITDEEGVLIKTLIQKSIDEGYLIREPGRKVEKEFSHVVHKQGKYKITLIGFMDLENPNEVLDHKFVKNMNYAMSTKVGAKRDIRKSIQMTTYGYAKYLDGHNGNMFLSLLYHIKSYENPAIKKRSVEVTEFEVKQFFNSYTLPNMKEMLAIDIKYPMQRVSDFLMVPGPDNPVQECNRHYGKPCPFMGVCQGYFSVQQYLATFGRDINDLLNPYIEGACNMSGTLLDICKKETQILAAETVAQPAVPVAVQPVVPVQPVAPVVPVVPVLPVAPAVVAQPTGLDALMSGTASPAVVQPVAPVQPAAVAPVQPVQPVAPAPASVVALVTESAQPAVPAVVRQEAPWYHRYEGTECMACKENPIKGYNSKMQPCIPCDARNDLAGIPNSSCYDVASNTDGTLSFTLKPVAGTAAPVIPVVETVVQAVAEPVVKAETVMAVEPVVPVAEIAAAGDNALENLLGSSVAKPAQPEARPITSALSQEAIAASSIAGAGAFDMLIGCSIIKGDRTAPFCSADLILEEVLLDISASAGKPIAQVEHFAMLQAIDACIPDMVASLKNLGTTVTCFPSTKGSAMDRLVEGLRIHADTVIAPIGI